MRFLTAGVTFGMAAAILGVAAGEARAVDSLYNMTSMMRSPHPFTVPYVPPPEPQPVSSPQPVPPPPPAASPPRPASLAPAAPVERRAQPARVETAQKPAAPKDERRGLWGVISEIRGGGLVHDEGPFSHRKEEGFDVNFEVLFVSPKFLDIIWSPRPHIGFDINTSGDTSEIYLGLSYEWEFWGGVFAGFSLGGAVHNGKTSGDHTDRKDLGCSVLFRESFEVGYRFVGTHSVSVMLDHISNAKLCDHNEGLENLGIRYGYKF